MIKITLQTNNIKKRKPGKSGFVTSLIMPPFTPIPDAVKWGGRTFFLQDIVDGIYVEGFLWEAQPENEVRGLPPNKGGRVDGLHSPKRNPKKS